MGYLIGVDIGGTFTDCAILDQDGRIHTGKAPTTPDNPVRGCFAAIEAAGQHLGLALDALLPRADRLVHGTTVGLNTITSRSGPDVGLLTTKGHGDFILIMNGGGRTAGLDIDELTYYPGSNTPEPIVPRSRIAEVTERVDAAGEIVVPLDVEETRRAIRHLVEEKRVEAIGICFLWSFLNPAHEHKAKELVQEIAPDIFVCCSSEVVPKLGEYERGATMLFNAYIGPVMQAYAGELERTARSHGFRHPIQFTHCAGGIMPLRDVRRQPVLTLNSGPVGGVVGSVFLGQALGTGSVITTDMGGTTFDVALIDQGVPLTRDLSIIQQYEIHVPMVDIESIGAGGGSLAWLDGAGNLHVGPKSAGAVPGPACYGKGGTEATVTDADVVLSVINPEYFLGGQIRLDHEAAVAAVSRLAERLGLGLDETAAGIARIVDTQMADLIRRMTVNKGYDPREFTLFAFGGGGPTHAGYFARELGVRQVVVPMGDPASVWSALGAASGDLIYVRERSLKLSAPFDAATVRAAVGALESEVLAEFAAEGIIARDVELTRLALMKYGRQVFEVETELPQDPLDAAALESLLARFESRYETRYGKGSGYREAGIQMTTLRLRGRVRGAPPALFVEEETGASVSTAAIQASRNVYWLEERGRIATPVYRGELVRPGNVVDGPAIIELPGTTIAVRPGQQTTKDRFGNFLLRV